MTIDKSVVIIFAELSIIAVTSCFIVCCYFTVFITIRVTLSPCSNLTVYQSVWCKLTDLFIRWYILPTTRVTVVL